MNKREIEQLVKKSIYTIQINNDLKDQVINGYLNELSITIKTQIKKKKLIIFLLENKD